MPSIVSKSCSLLIQIPTTVLPTSVITTSLTRLTTTPPTTAPVTTRLPTVNPTTALPLPGEIYLKKYYVTLCIVLCINIKSMYFATSQ